MVRSRRYNWLASDISNTQHTYTQQFVELSPAVPSTVEMFTETGIVAFPIFTILSIVEPPSVTEYVTGSNCITTPGARQYTVETG